MANATKKYYWLKLKEDFFRDKKIKKLRRIAGGDTFTIIYLKMQLLSLQHEGKLYFDNIEENLVEELALELDEEVENVSMTVAYLMKNGLLEEVEADSYILPQAIQSIGSESSSAERVRRHRAKKKQLPEPEQTPELPEPEKPVLQCNTSVTNSNTEIEQEKEKEKEKDTELTDRERKRVDLLRDLFAGWQVNDYQIFYLSTLINKRIPYAAESLEDRESKIYNFMDHLMKKAKAENVKHIYRWLETVIPVIEMEGLDYEEELPY